MQEITKKRDKSLKKKDKSHSSKSSKRHKSSSYQDKEKSDAKKSHQRSSSPPKTLKQVSTPTLSNNTSNKETSFKPPTYCRKDIESNHTTYDHTYDKNGLHSYESRQKNDFRTTSDKDQKNHDYKHSKDKRYEQSPRRSEDRNRKYDRNNDYNSKASGSRYNNRNEVHDRDHHSNSSHYNRPKREYDTHLTSRHIQESAVSSDHMEKERKRKLAEMQLNAKSVEDSRKSYVEKIRQDEKQEEIDSLNERIKHSINGTTSSYLEQINDSAYGKDSQMSLQDRIHRNRAFLSRDLSAEE
ncbi:hypothetical protein AYI70_g4035 [Smittium culicis]|uniref:Uncharacterized protein n=1 Tax=Smittium culicis TaxID=133412 RepID=A0A1R1Y0S8_9FUNG|nr:hypothetical protein AYI70_g4035 [Smittium culicis]